MGTCIKFGQWKVVGIGPHTETGCRRRPTLIVECSCGFRKVVRKSDLRQGRSTKCKSCSMKQLGNSRRKGRTHHILKRRWNDMLRRCYDTRSNGYRSYGGRGIRVHKPWHNFPTFKRWAIKKGYRNSLTIERKNVNRSYEPKNCTWIPKNMQGANTTKTRKIYFNGRTQHLAAWSREYGINTTTIQNRLERGWSIEKALLTPPQKQAAID